MRGRQPAQRTPRAQAHHQRGHHQPRDPEAPRGELLPGGPDKALLSHGLRGHCRRLRDGNRRRVHEKGETRGAVHGHRPLERRPGVQDALAAAIGAGSGVCGRLFGLDAVDTEPHGGWRAFPLSLWGSVSTGLSSASPATQTRAPSAPSGRCSPAGSRSSG